jgi:uncharacterized membrane protein YvlD (DUF360 family)
VTVSRVVITGFALWLAAWLVAGINLETGPDPLAVAGTVGLVALVLLVLERLTWSLRRVVASVARPLPVAMMALVGFDAALLWLATSFAGAVGLKYTVDSYLSAVLGALVLLVAGWCGRLLLPHTPPAA